MNNHQVYLCPFEFWLLDQSFSIFVLKAHVQLMEDGGSGVSTQSAGASWVRLVEKGLGSELGPVTHRSQDMVADTVQDRGCSC